MPGWQKPIRGATLNRAHPLARGLGIYYGCIEGHGNIVYDLARSASAGDLTRGTGTAWRGTSGGWGVDCSAASAIPLEPPSPDPGIWHNAFNAVSIVVWCTLESYPNAFCILMEEGGSGAGYAIAYRAGGADTICFGTAQNSVRVEIASLVAYHGSPDVLCVVGTYDAGAMAFYINGILQGTNTNGTSIPAHSSDPAVGYDINSNAFNGAVGAYWPGCVLGLARYNRALSASEAAWLSHEPSAMLQRETPVWAFYEAAATAVYPVFGGRHIIR